MRKSINLLMLILITTNGLDYNYGMESSAGLFLRKISLLKSKKNFNTNLFDFGVILSPHSTPINEKAL